MLLWPLLWPLMLPLMLLLPPLMQEWRLGLLLLDDPLPLEAPLLEDRIRVARETAFVRPEDDEDREGEDEVEEET